MKEERKGMLIVISGPSGTGKGTICEKLLAEDPSLTFSVSATTRYRRETEIDGVHYHFLTEEKYDELLAQDAFLEHATVHGHRYGTLKAQVERQLEAGQHVVFDVDVVGGCNIKEYYGDRALSLFIQPPSVEELRRRLEGRGTDAPEIIQQRIDKAEYELSFAPKFDKVVINDDLATAQAEALAIIKEFVEG